MFRFLMSIKLPKDGIRAEAIKVCLCFSVLSSLRQVSNHGSVYELVAHESLPEQ